MALLSIEHSPAAHWADFLVYGSAALALAGWLALQASAVGGLVLLGWAGLMLVGLAAWTLLEYGLHRFVLHGLQPFARWHAQHHRAPMALIGTPTVVSAPLFALLFAVPSVALLGPLLGAVFTLGALLGYLAYSATHHVLHHRKLTHPWWQRRKFAHAKHHHLMQPCCFGVTSGFWDWVLRTGGHVVRVPVFLPADASEAPAVQRPASPPVHIPVVRRCG